MRILLILSCLVSSALAQTSDIALSNFNEVKGELSRAAGNVDLIVGLAYGGDGKDNHREVVIPNPIAKNNAFCLQMRSRDAQYAASANLSISYLPKDKLGIHVPISEEKRYTGAFDEADLPKLIYERNPKFTGCQADKASHFVPVISKKLAENELNVYINAPNSRVRAQLFMNKGMSEIKNDVTDADKLTELVVCQPLKEGIRAGYSAICKLTAPKGHKSDKGYLLSISENNQGVEAVKRVKLTLVGQ